MRAVLHKWDLEVNRIREFRLRDNGKCDIKSGDVVIVISINIQPSKL